MPLIINLDDPAQNKYNPETVGNKAWKLMILKKIGINIPPGFVLTSGFFEGVLKHNKLDRVLSRLLIPSTENHSYLFKKLQHLFAAAQIPQDFLHLLKENIAELNGNRLMVRSSAIGEDSSQSSFAGIYASFAQVPADQPGEVVKSILNCYLSLYSKQAFVYRKKKKIRQVLCMPVILQIMIPADISGVLFTQTPSKEYVTLEASRGHGGGVHGDRETDHLVIDKKDLRITRREESLFGIEMGLLHKIITEAEKIEAHFQKPQDIEWACCRNRLYILQSRPLVKANSIEIDSYSRCENISGVLKKAPYRKNIKAPCILHIERPSPAHIIHLENCKAVISTQGGILNHFAIVCRELGIPYYVCHRDLTHFKDGDFINLSFSEKIKAENRLDWRQVIQFIPPVDGENYMDIIRQKTKNIPGLIKLDGMLEVKVKPGGIYITTESIKRLVENVASHLARVRAALSNMKNCAYTVYAGIMSAILTEPLFNRLCALTGDFDIASRFVSGIDALYFFDFNPSYTCTECDKHLRRFGIKPGTRLMIPGNLQERQKLQDHKNKAELKVFLESLDNELAGRIELLAEVIINLIHFYEHKNKVAMKKPAASAL